MIVRASLLLAALLLALPARVTAEAGRETSTLPIQIYVSSKAGEKAGRKTYAGAVAKIISKEHDVVIVEKRFHDNVPVSPAAACTVQPRSAPCSPC